MTIYNLGNRVVNNYLISCPDGYILIDTGYEDGFRRFLKKLQKSNISPMKIKYIFLTHAHDDHAGFLNDVLAITDAVVILHPKALAGLQKGQNSFEGGCSSRLAHFFCMILALFGKGDHRYPSIQSKYLDRLITIDSEAFHDMHFPYTIIETPGHTADHISLLAEDLLFCGDAAMNGFPSIKRVIIWIENLQEFKSSWQRILDISPSMVYPAHGKPFPVSDIKKYFSHLDTIQLHPLKPVTRKL